MELALRPQSRPEAVVRRHAPSATRRRTFEANGIEYEASRVRSGSRRAFVMEQSELTCPLCGAEVPRPESGVSQSVGEQPKRETTTCPNCEALLMRQVEPAHAPWQAAETSGG